MKPHLVRERTLLEELELRQNEVLDQLADLERRLEELLNEYVQALSYRAPGDG